MYVGAMIHRTGPLHRWAYFKDGEYGKTKAPPMVIGSIQLNDPRCFFPAEDLAFDEVVLDQAFCGALVWRELYALAKYYRILLAKQAIPPGKHHIPINYSFLEELKSVCERSLKKSLTLKALELRYEDVEKRCRDRKPGIASLGSREMIRTTLTTNLVTKFVVSLRES
jgi:hypothetical protein